MGAGESSHLETTRQTLQEVRASFVGIREDLGSIISWYIC